MKTEKEPQATMLAALKRAEELIRTARRYFPKSIHNSDKWALELSCAEIGKAIAEAEEKS